jgi:hypothetical protein
LDVLAEVFVIESMTLFVFDLGLKIRVSVVGLVIEEAQIVLHKAQRPRLVTALLDADLLAGKALTDV